MNNWKTLLFASVMLFVLPACTLVGPGGWIWDTTQVTVVQQSAPAVEQAPAVQQSDPAPQSGQTALYEHSGPTTAEAKQAIDLDIQRLDTEPSAFVWRSAPMSADGRCPTGAVCTLHLANGEIWVVKGDGTMYSIVAGTFRFVSAYPENDAVHNPCELVAKEQTFGQLEDPSFKVGTNLICN